MSDWKEEIIEIVDELNKASELIKGSCLGSDETDKYTFELEEMALDILHWAGNPKRAREPLYKA